MSRNMLRRVELAWPIEDADMKKRIMDELLAPYLHDQLDAWVLQPSGEYQAVKPANLLAISDHKLVSAQTLLMQKYR
jgi:polyphosphate kinase